jgi:chromosome transmission fidelity protein 8
MIISINALASSSRASGAAELPPVLADLGNSEIVLLELQGDIEVEGDRAGQTVGKLTMEPGGKVRLTGSPRLTRVHDLIVVEQGKPTLRIGIHLLEGKIITLPKPLAVLQRCPVSEDKTGEHDPDEPTPARLPPTYTIRAIVRKKLLFAKRPMPIVGSGPSIPPRDGKPMSSVGQSRS